MAAISELKVDSAAGEEEESEDDDYGLLLPREAQRYAATASLGSVVSLSDDEPLIIAYEVTLQRGLDCGGAYVKVFDDTVAVDAVSPASPYTIMFGPDKCGSNNKIHFIFPHKNPVTQTWEEKHQNETGVLKGDKKTHLYTLSLQADNNFAVYIDKVLSKRGSLLTHMKPAVNPPVNIDDPTDFKPSDWVDESQIDDPAAFKPDDWDESAPRMIPNEAAVKPETWLDDGQKKIADPNAVKPDDWDDEQVRILLFLCLFNGACWNLCTD